MFNSVPVGLFWLVSVGLLVARLVRPRALVRSPGVSAACLGVLLVVLGGLYGSQTGHQVAGRLLGSAKVPSGYIVVSQAAERDQVIDLEMEREVGRLPFGLRLRGFRTDYHDAQPPAQDMAVERRVLSYNSDVVVLAGGHEVAQQVIRANHPLHYGGYHFYQFDYDAREQPYTALLLVKSDTGLGLVYAGLCLLCVGAVWACWVRPAWAFLARRSGRHGG
ncbi:MAG: cytochrome c biogenesis protein ResB [Candidatus Brocadiae bacterium]|nr:cytochrome c biogenesis protein ResB [Candidatus Brocadiia bacterium]